MPSHNTLIALAFILAVPAFVCWGALSAYVWWVEGREVGLRNYRLAVTVFLAAMTVLILDIGRIRQHAFDGVVDADPDSWLVVAIRYAWLVSVYWATIALYGRLARNLWRWLTRRAPPGPTPVGIDPSEEALRHAEMQVQRANFLMEQVQRARQEFVRVIKGIDGDDPVFVIVRKEPRQ